MPTHGATRQLLCQAEGYSVDLRFDEEQTAGKIRLMGQIMSQVQPQATLSGVPVQVMAGRKVVARGLSNQFGEFCLSYDARQNLRLLLTLAESGECVELSLNTLRVRS